MCSVTYSYICHNNLIDIVFMLIINFICTGRNQPVACLVCLECLTANSTIFPIWNSQEMILDEDQLGAKVEWNQKLTTIGLVRQPYKLSLMHST